MTVLGSALYKTDSRPDTERTSVNPLREMEAQLTQILEFAKIKKRIHHFAISDRSVVVCLLWDLGEKELSGAES